MRGLLTRVERRRLSTSVVALVFCLPILLVMPASSFSDSGGEAVHEERSSSIHQAATDGTVYIRTDGSVDPSTAPIQRDGDKYTLTDNVYESIVVERDNVVFDGAGHTLQGTGADPSTGILVAERANVTIRNARIDAFEVGIHVSWCQDVWIDGNFIANGTQDIYGSQRGIHVDRSQNVRVTGNSLKNGTLNSHGILLDGSSHNAVSRNSITNYSAGIIVEGYPYQSSYNFIFENSMTYNDCGIILHESSSNTFAGNYIAKNDWGVWFFYAPGNTLFHNNFVNNSIQVYDAEAANWDDGYPSGGNHWSDYSGVDEKTGADQDHLGSDGIGDTLYVIYSGLIDRYPLMNPWNPSGIHELYATVPSPAVRTLGVPSPLTGAVTNQGTLDEADVKLDLSIDGTTVGSITIPLLRSGDTQIIQYLWIPAVRGEYNLTAYAHPISGEISVDNNQEIKLMSVWAIGVHSGDWIKYAYTYEIEPSTPHTEWVKLEFLSVEVTTVTVRGTLNVSGGTEQTETFSVILSYFDPWMGTPSFDTLTSFVIQCNSTYGDVARIRDVGKPCALVNWANSTLGGTIEGEVGRDYAGASRNAVYATYSSFVEYGPLTFYWDKETGVLLEASCSRSDGWTATAVETNMWQIQPSAHPANSTVLYVLGIAAIVIIVAVALLVMRRKKEPDLTFARTEEPPTASPRT